MMGLMNSCWGYLYKINLFVLKVIVFYYWYEYIMIR